MSSVIDDPEVDVVIVGAGATGGSLSALLVQAGLSVACIEKGPFWDFTNDFQATQKRDEWGIIIKRKFDHPIRLWTPTIRNSRDQFAEPTRRYWTGQIIAMGHGVGGATQHWAGGLGRISPWAMQAHSETVSKYGSSMLPSNSELTDWPLTYDQAVPYLEEWEKEWGVVGENQNPFTPMSSNYPLPPHPSTPVGEMFRSATESLGYHPHPAVGALKSQPYVNQFGVASNACNYNGWCGEVCDFVCETGAKTNSSQTSIPYALKSPKYTLRTESIVFRVELNRSGTRAVGVSYYDPSGNVHFQPAKVVHLAAYSQNVIRLMLLSGIGKPYDPVTQTGSIGRGITDNRAPPATSVSGTINMGANRYPSGNASGGGFAIEDFADDNFDHTGLNFIGGDNIRMGGYRGSGPGQLMLFQPGPQNFGSAYKASLKDAMLEQKMSLRISAPGPSLPTTDFYADLDPSYVDAFGDPQLRMTFDFQPSQNAAADYIAPLAQGILTKMGATDVKINKVPPGTRHWDSWSIHIRGGTRLGSDPSNSAFNKWMQSWVVENLFASGESLSPFSDNTSQGTHAMGFHAYVAADGIQKYLQSPGPLV